MRGVRLSVGMYVSDEKGSMIRMLLDHWAKIARSQSTNTMSAEALAAAVLETIFGDVNTDQFAAAFSGSSLEMKSRAWQLNELLRTLIQIRLTGHWMGGQLERQLEAEGGCCRSATGSRACSGYVFNSWVTVGWAETEVYHLCDETFGPLRKDLPVLLAADDQSLMLVKAQALDRPGAGAKAAFKVSEGFPSSSSNMLRVVQIVGPHMQFVLQAPSARDRAWWICHINAARELAINGDARDCGAQRKVLEQLWKVDGNLHCLECQKPDPEWAVVNLGIL